MMRLCALSQVVSILIFLSFGDPIQNCIPFGLTFHELLKIGLGGTRALKSKPGVEDLTEFRIH